VYLYLDTKIYGTIKIIVSYYQNGVFNKDVKILFKLYKENKSFLKLLKKERIDVIIIKKWNDIPDLKNRKIYYMFNAQSNCRMVAYREATHIFIGHGESNKLSSAKPIFRIYDYIYVSGKASIDRFLQNGIFNRCDVNDKIVKVGNKYIGNAYYRFGQKQTYKSLKI